MRLRAGTEEGEMPELELRDEAGHSRVLLRVRHDGMTLL